jgi:major tropism determinant Mtd-like protein
MTRIQLRRGTAAAWTAANPTLSSAELGVETDTDKVKVGDGQTHWTSLAYLGDGSVDLTKQAVIATGVKATDLDGAASSALTAEVSRAQAAEALLATSSALAAEVSRAEAAEALLAPLTGLTAEVTRAEAAEALLAPASALAAEVSRAQAAEALLAHVTVTSTQQPGSYTFALADAGTVVEGVGATAQTFTIPPHSAVAFPVGTVIEVFQYGAGQIVLAPGAGVTLRSDGGKAATAAQYATVGLRQRAADEWVLSGDLGAAA